MSNTSFSLWASIIRTIIPTLVGGAASFLIGLGLTVDPEFEGTLAAFLTVALTGVYYIGVRLLETYVTPKLGWLLGLAKTPATYTSESPAD